LHALGRGLVTENLRGNVDTRLRKLDEGYYEAIVLAAAGLRRLGWADRIRDLIDPDVMCPAAGQGALAIETRDDGGAAQEIAGKLNHAATNAAVTAERSLLAMLEGGCQVPIGAYAHFEGPVLHLMAIVASPDGARLIKDKASGGDPVALGRELGERMLAAGAREILGR
jgi:hydroxymethylbilane synthase